MIVTPRRQGLGFRAYFEGKGFASTLGVRYEKKPEEWVQFQGLWLDQLEIAINSDSK